MTASEKKDNNEETKKEAPYEQRIDKNPDFDPRVKETSKKKNDAEVESPA